MNTHIRSVLATGATLLALTACGGGGSSEPTPPTPKARINSSNYADAIGLAATGSGNSQHAMAATMLPFDLGIVGREPGIINCPGGGSVTVSVVDKTSTVVAQNCKNDDVELISGTLSLSMDVSSNLPQRVQFKDMKARGLDANASLATVNGEVKIEEIKNGQPTSVSAKVNISNGTRTDGYEMLLTATGQLTLTLTSSSFDGPLRITLDEPARRLVLSSLADQSSATLVWSADQKTITVELRESENGPVVLSKTLTEAEWLALLRKWS